MGDMYTITFNELKELGISPFPSYTYKQITFLDKTLTQDEFEKLFYDYYGSYQIAYPTHTEFCFEFARIFNRNYDIFNKKIEMFNKLNFDTTEYVKDIEGSSDSQRKYSDTPNESLDNAGNLGDSFLTDVSKEGVAGSSKETYKSNDIIKFNDVEAKINNVIYEFLDKFNDCFLTYKVTKTYYKWRWQV